MNTAQPEALRCASMIESMGCEGRESAAELRRLHALINTPELLSFRDGVVQEAVHQQERWGTEHDSGKTPEDWFWLIGYLAGRALEHHKEAERLDGEISNSSAPEYEVLRRQIARHREKAVHHCITAAAACANWHAAVVGHLNMRPGVDPASIIAAAGETA